VDWGRPLTGPAPEPVVVLDRRLLREAPEARRFLIGAFVLAAAAAALVIAWAELIGRIVARVFLEGDGIGSLRGLIVVLALIAVARSALGWALETSGAVTSSRLRRRLRLRAVEHVLRARPAGLRDLRAGEVTTSVTSGLDALDPYFERFFPQLVLAAVVSPAILVWVGFRDPVSALIMAVTLPLIPLFAILIGKAAEERTSRRLEALARLSSHFLDVVRGLATLRAYRRGRAQVETIARASEEFRTETMGTLRIAFLSALVLELLATIGIALIAATIGIRLVNGSVGLAPSFAVLVLAPELYLPWRGVAAQFHASGDGLAAARRAFELIDLEPAAGAPTQTRSSPDPRLMPLRCQDLGFAYEGRGAPVFDAFSCEIRPGERTILSGDNGAGKTTLLALFMRFSDPDRGRIAVGDSDLRSLDPEEWRRRIAWLPQRPRLLAGTIAEALRIGAPEAADERLWRALEAAGMANFVVGLADGLATAVGEGGRPLSAGELRRIALARALVREAPLLLLDEPTAHLDLATAAAIRKALAGLDGRSTVVIATHDPELIALGDRVIELEPIGQGSPG
jgi:ATP-binding cassette subfamily C protein CydD